MTYRDLVTLTGQFNVREIMDHAHRKARVELEGHRRVADKFFGGKITFTYAQLFKVELAQAWSWARAIQGAGQGKAPARSVAMFAEAA